MIKGQRTHSLSIKSLEVVAVALPLYLAWYNLVQKYQAVNGVVPAMARTAMFALSIDAWHAEMAWSRYELRSIESRVRDFTNLKQKRDVKATARRFRSKDCFEINSHCSIGAIAVLRFRDLLLSLGADTTVKEIPNPLA